MYSSGSLLEDQQAVEKALTGFGSCPGRREALWRGSGGGLGCLPGSHSHSWPLEAVWSTEDLGRREKQPQAPIPDQSDFEGLRGKAPRLTAGRICLAHRMGAPWLAAAHF